MAGAAASLAPVSCPMTIMSKAVGCIKKQRARSFYRAWIILCYRPVPAWRRSDHQQVKQEVLWNGCFCRSGAIPSFPAVRGVDRKSVVSGKSVSVRVDLGGRRIIKKKKQTQ